MNKIKSFISMLIILVGSIGVGICLMLSELLYSDIDEFNLCPAWYKMTMYISLGVCFVGIFSCFFTKNRSLFV